MRTIVLISNIKPIEDRALYHLAFRQASPQRREKVLSYRNDLAKRQALCAEVLLREGLKAFGYSEPELAYEFGANGKPYLVGIEEVHFNISHSGDYVMCAVSTEEIGCDVEAVSEKTAERDLRIAERFFRKEEVQAIQNASSEQEKRELFFRYWTRKESFMKLTGLGMKLPMNAFQIVEEQGSLFVMQGDMAERYALKEWDLITGYRCCICQKEIPENTMIQMVNLEKLLADSFQIAGYHGRKLSEKDVPEIYELCKGNAFYYEFFPPVATEESINKDLTALPPGKGLEDKFYLGFYQGDLLIAVLDFIVGYPKEEVGWIGFFMTNVSVQGQGIGSKLIDGLCEFLKDSGLRRLSLAWVKGNPQSEHFWHKNGFLETGKEQESEGHTVVIASKEL